MEKKEYQLNFNVDISALTEVKNILQDISVQFQELLLYNVVNVSIWRL